MEQTNEPAVTDSNPSPTQLDIEARESMIAEAEQRGYDKARAEMAQARMDSPAVGEQPGIAPPQVSHETFLSNIRPSVWD